MTGLTEREHDVIAWLAGGATGPQMSKALGLGATAINNAILSARRKLGAHNSPHLVAVAYQRGILAIDRDDDTPGHGLGDTVNARDIPAEILDLARFNIGECVRGLDADTADEVVAGVLHAVGHYLITEAVTDRIGTRVADELGELMPQHPYDRGEAVDTLLWSVLNAVGVRAL